MVTDYIYIELLPKALSLLFTHSHTNTHTHLHTMAVSYHIRCRHIHKNTCVIVIENICSYVLLKKKKRLIYLDSTTDDLHCAYKWKPTKYG